MCTHNHWFMTYEKNSSGNVLMGNNVSCKFIDIGFVQIRMHDGVVKTQIEVCHVLELKKNLVTMGVMHLKGFLVGLKVELCTSKGKGSIW